MMFRISHIAACGSLVRWGDPCDLLCAEGLFQLILCILLQEGLAVREDLKTTKNIKQQ